METKAREQHSTSLADNGSLVVFDDHHLMIVVVVMAVVVMFVRNISLMVSNHDHISSYDG
jgi:hypothetical protein